MGMFNRLLYLTDKRYKTNKAEIVFTLITESGEEIIQIIKPTIFNKYYYTDGGYFPETEIAIKISKDMGAIFNKEAGEILTKYRVKSRHDLDRGKLDSGEYIVKCVWHVWCDHSDLELWSYDEWLKMRKNGTPKSLKQAEKEEQIWFDGFDGMLKKYGLETLTPDQKKKVRELIGDEEFMG